MRLTTAWPWGHVPPPQITLLGPPPQITLLGPPPPIAPRAGQFHMAGGAFPPHPA